MQARILIVDDVPINTEFLEGLLTSRGHVTMIAESGPEALELIEKESPDLVLLDVVMPEMSGYEVCDRIRQNPETNLLPVVMISALNAIDERPRAFEAGADDFLEKPIRKDEFLARIRSLLRVKELHDTVRAKTQEVEDLNATLEQRVEAQVAELDRLVRLKRFFSPELAELIVSGRGHGILESHRTYITVVFVDLRGFTAFAESSEPEELMGMLRDYHSEMGRLVLAHQGTLERFTGDGMMIFFNDPVAVSDPEWRAVQMAIEMRESAEKLRAGWLKLGFDLNFSVGIAAGFATLGAIGFEGRFDYAAIGSVTNLAGRLCDRARGGQILVTQRVLGAVCELVETHGMGEIKLRGFSRAIPVHNVVRAISPTRVMV